MLIRFSVENYLSYKSKQVLDLSAATTCKENIEDNTFKINGIPLLKTAVIYGANASGKSNLIVALQRMKDIVINSSKESQAKEEIPLIPFKLNAASSIKPSIFEIEFLQNAKRYRYGFEADNKEIKREWLFEDIGKKEQQPLFLRINENEKDDIRIFDGMKDAKGLDIRTRKNALFLSVCAQFSEKKAEEIIDWFVSRCHIIFDQEKCMGYTLRQMADINFKQDVIKLMQNADIDIQDFHIIKLDWLKNDIPEELKNKLKKISEENIRRVMIKTVHNMYDDHNNVIGDTEFDLGLESKGTQKALALSGPIIDTLKNGHILFIDELDTSIHPILTKAIVRMFNSREYNPHNAQLIFTTHDTNLLSSKMPVSGNKKERQLLRRDQIYFTEKDLCEASQLYSLVDYKLSDGKKTRNDASFEKDYLTGKYGAIPFPGELISGENE